jgi:hypothetical protein
MKMLALFFVAATVAAALGFLLLNSAVDVSPLEQSEYNAEQIIVPFVESVEADPVRVTHVWKIDGAYTFRVPE